MRTARKYQLLLVVLTVGACGGNHTKKNDLDEPERGGAALEPISFRYADNKPSVSTDGTKVVFVSGRDSSDTVATSKAYKATWAAGAEPAAPARVSIDDSVGIEKGAWISPDGTWVLLLSANGASTDLYLQDFAGAKAPVKITDDASLESLPSFSPDSKLIAWLSTDKDQKTIVAKVVEIGDASASTLAKQKVVTPDTQTVKQVFWLPAETGYKLALATVEGSANSATYVQRSFADFAALAAAKDAAWFANFVPDASIMPVAAADSVLLVRRLLSTDNLLVDKIGTNLTDGLLQTPAASEPGWIKMTPDAVMSRYATIPGQQTLAVGIAADGLTNFLLVRHFYRCTEQKVDSFGTAFVVVPADPATALTRLLPRLDSDHEHLFAASDVCELGADGNLARLDDKISEMVVPANATTQKYRIIYTTRFTTKFDVSCVLRSGDMEVMALDVDGDTKTFYPLSKNPAPLVDADRGGAAPCIL